MSQFSSLDLQIWHGSRSRQYLLDKNKDNDDFSTVPPSYAPEPPPLMPLTSLYLSA